jgi:hypothetical protein
MDSRVKRYWRGLAIAVAAASIVAVAAVSTPSPAEAYATTGCRWGTGTLRLVTVYVPDGAFRTALFNGVSQYSSATDVNLSTTDTRGPSWNAQVTNFGNTGAEADASWSCSGGITNASTMRLNTAYLNTSMPSARLKVVWEHEMGHSLGLQHVASNTRVMYQSASTAYISGGVRGLTSDEINGINALY